MLNRYFLIAILPLMLVACEQKQQTVEVEEITEEVNMDTTMVDQDLGGQHIAGNTKVKSDSEHYIPGASIDVYNKANAIVASQKAIITAFYSSYCKKKGAVLETELRRTCTVKLVDRAKTFIDDDNCDTKRFGCGLDDPGDGPWELLDIKQQGQNMFVVTVREGKCVTELRVTCSHEDGRWKIDTVTRLNVENEAESD